MAKKEAHNAQVLAEALALKQRSIMDFGQAIDSFRQRLLKGDIVSAKKLDVLSLGYLFACGQYRDCYQKATELYSYFSKKKDAEYMGHALYYIARSRIFLGETDGVLQQLLSSIELLSQAGEAETALTAEHALSDLFYSMGFFDQALAILYRHLHIARGRKESVGELILSSKIAAVLRETNQWEQSAQVLDGLKPLVDSGLVPMPFPISYWREWADLYLKQGHPAKALEIYEKYFAQGLSAYKHAELYGMSIHARCLLALKKYKEATDVGERYVVASKASGMPVQLLGAYKLQIDIAFAKKDMADALKKLKLMSTLAPASLGPKHELLYERCAATCCEAADDIPAAMQHYKRCLELEHDIQRRDGDIKLKALYQLSQEEFKNDELREIKNQLQMKRDELEISAIYLKQHQTMLSELDDFMKELREDNKRKRNIFKEVHNKIKALQLYETDKRNIEDKINSEQQQYMVQVKAKYPGLSNTEARICSLLRSGLSSKEIAALLIIDPHTVEQHRYRIRRKLSIQKGDDLMLVLNQV